MNRDVAKIVIVGVVLAAAGGIVWAKQGRVASDATSSTEAATNAAAPPDPPAGIPRLLDLGADKCVPCKMMKPILDEMRDEYAGRMEVDFIDVWKEPDAGLAHGIDVIPTQIFFSADGTELRRHQGFMSKEDILKAWAELGVTFPAVKPEA